MKISETGLALLTTGITVALATTGALTPIASFYNPSVPWLLWPTTSAYALSIFVVCYAALLGGPRSSTSLLWPWMGFLLVMVLAPLKVLLDWGSWGGWILGSAILLLPIPVLLLAATLCAVPPFARLLRGEGLERSAVGGITVNAAMIPRPGFLHARFLLAALWLCVCGYTAATLSLRGTPRLSNLLAAPFKPMYPYPSGLGLTLTSGVFLLFHSLRFPGHRHQISPGPRLTLLLLALAGFLAILACGDIGLWGCYDPRSLHHWADALQPGTLEFYKHMATRAKILLLFEFRTVQILVAAASAVIVWREARGLRWGPRQGKLVKGESGPS